MRRAVVGGFFAVWGVAEAALGGAADARAETELRPYMRFALGQSFFTDASAVTGAVLKTPANNPVGQIAVGADIGPRLGIELAGDYVKTDMTAPGQGKVGDYSLTALLAQARLRFPRNGSAFVPYVLGGGGVGYGEFSGRENFTVPIGGRGWAGLGVAGAGFDYFVADNVALGMEAKYSFLFSPPVESNGLKQDLTADTIAVTGGMRVYLDHSGTGAAARRAEAKPPRDSDARRPFVAIRLGTAFFTDADATASSGINIEGRSGILGGGSLGMNFNRHWGAEFAFDYTRAQITSPVFGKVSGYPVWTILALGRYRYPILEGRLSPYLLAGAGIGYGEAGDADIPSSISKFRAKPDSSFIAAVGAGIDYFVEDNVAFGLEVKQSFLFDTEVTVNTVRRGLYPDLVEVTAGIRVFFR
ncbi:MAG: outer membrane beta-barrel protein [Alphaproteobacteria bacterium]